MGLKGLRVAKPARRISRARCCTENLQTLMLPLTAQAIKLRESGVPVGEVSTLHK